MQSIAKNGPGGLNYKDAFPRSPAPGVVHIKVDSQGSRIVEILLRFGPGDALVGVVGCGKGVPGYATNGGRADSARNPISGAG